MAKKSTRLLDIKYEITSQQRSIQINSKDNSYKFLGFEAKMIFLSIKMISTAVIF